MISLLTKYARNALNSQFRKLGYPLRWMPPAVLSQHGQMLEVNFPMLAAHLMLTTKRPYFIGIGANDGVTHDPLYPFIRDFGWRGIMVEPVPKAFAALASNYTRFPDVTLVEAAIGKQDGKGIIYTVETSGQNSLMMSLHSSFSKEMLLRGKTWHPDLEKYIIEREVTIMSFASLLERIDGHTVDVLKIDTEGYDLQILQSVDLAHLSPSLVLAEHANLSRQDVIIMADILLAQGYQVSMTSLDMLGYKTPKAD